MLKIDHNGGVLLLTIDRESAGNAISGDLADAFASALDAAADDAALRAIVITGAGGKFFCAGGDLKNYRRLTDRATLERVFAKTRTVLDRLEAAAVPVIAAVNGYALGGGGELLLACDIRIAKPAALIGFPQARLGIIPGWNGIERLIPRSADNDP